MSEKIVQYAIQKTPEIEDLEFERTPLNFLLQSLKIEYGFVAPVLRNKRKVDLITLRISEDLFAFHRAHLQNCEAREPCSKNPIIGILVLHEEKYRIIDGYHRFKWAIKNLSSGQFLLLT